MKFKNICLFLLTSFFTNTQITFAQDYDALKNKLTNNFPKTFNGQKIPQRTYSFGQTIINQIIEDLRKIGFDEDEAIWLHANDYVLYDAKTAKLIGNTYWLAYKTEDNKVLGTYMMNCQNPANNRLMHTSYNVSGGSYKIKEKITLHNFSHLVCKKHEKRIQRF